MATVTFSTVKRNRYFRQYYFLQHLIKSLFRANRRRKSLRFNKDVEGGLHRVLRLGD